MPRLRDALQASEPLRRKIFQVEFLATLSGECLVSLVSPPPARRGLGRPPRARARRRAGHPAHRPQPQAEDRARSRLGAGGARGRRPAPALPAVRGQFHPAQRRREPAHAGWARAQAKTVGARPQGPGDLLELYCGNGNFTVALAPLFGRVLATEMSKTSVRAAHTNLADNGVANVTMVRMASEEISDAFRRRREYRRMRAWTWPATASPRLRRPAARRPRRGHGRAGEGFRPHPLHLLQPGDPARQRRRAGATHRIAAAAAFDQFPYTHHLECGLLLQRR